MTRIIVAGSREFNDYEMLNSILEGYLNGIDKNEITIVSGRAAGADTLGEVFADNHSMNLALFPADWQKYGHEAGFIRNGEMADFAVADGNKGVLFAFWNGISNGTKDMINKAKMHDMEVHIIVYKINDDNEYEILFETDALDLEKLKELEELKLEEDFMNPPENNISDDEEVEDNDEEYNYEETDDDNYDEY